MTDALTVPTARLAGFIDTHGSMNEELPLVHTMLCDQFQTATADNQLNPVECDVFNEPLVYLFYGRPAFRSLRTSKLTTRISLCPVCLVFKPNTITGLIHRLFPLDSGALNGGWFEPTIPKEHLPRYLLSSLIDSARRYTSLYFETNRQYFLASPKIGLTFPPEHHDAINLYKLVTTEGETDFDDRRAAVEVQAKVPVPLKDNLLTIVLPTSFLESKPISEVVLKEWRVLPLTYSVTRGASPSEYYGVIRDRIEQSLRQGGCL